MNEIVNEFLLAQENFIHKLHVRQSGFTYSVCGPFTKHREIQKLRKTGDLTHAYKNQLDKACLFMMLCMQIISI